PCVPSGRTEVTTRDRGRARIEVQLDAQVRVADLILELHRPVGPGDGLVVVEGGRLCEGTRRVSKDAKLWISETIGELDRLRGSLHPLVTVPVRAPDQRLCTRGTRRLRELEGLCHPPFHELVLGPAPPHPGPN